MEDITLTSKATGSQNDNADREFISLLITLYRDCPELWKKSKFYFNKNKRNAALEKIVGALKELKPDFTVEKLKQKINVLRTNFNRERKIIEDRRISMASTVYTPEPSLWYYNELSFIKDQIDISPNEVEPPLPEDSQSKFGSQCQASLSSPGVKPTPEPSHRFHKKRRCQLDPIEQLVGIATEYLSQPETEEEMLSKVWAMKLRKLNPDQKRFAEKVINEVLFEAEMGTLTRDVGLRFERPPPS